MILQIISIQFFVYPETGSGNYFVIIETLLFSVSYRKERNMIKLHVICLMVMILTTFSAHAQNTISPSLDDLKKEIQERMQKNLESNQPVTESQRVKDLKKEVQERVSEERKGFGHFEKKVTPQDIKPNDVFKALNEYQQAVQKSSDKKAFADNIPSGLEQVSQAVVDTLSIPDSGEFREKANLNKIGKIVVKRAVPVIKFMDSSITFVDSLKKQRDEIFFEPRLNSIVNLVEALRPGMVGPVNIELEMDEKGQPLGVLVSATNGVYHQYARIPMRATDELTIYAGGLITKGEFYPDFVVTQKSVTVSNALQNKLTIEKMFAKAHSQIDEHQKVITERFVKARSKLGEFNKRVNEKLRNSANTTMSDADVARVNALSQKIQELETDYKSRVAKNRLSPVDEDILQTELDLVMLGLEPELISSTVTVKTEVRLALQKNIFLKEVLAKQKQNALITDSLNKSAVGDKNALASLYKEREKFRELEKKSPTYDQRVVERYLSERIGRIEARDKLQELEKKSPTYDQREMIRSLNREISKHESYGKSFQERNQARNQESRSGWDRNARDRDSRYGNDSNYSAPSGWGGNSDGKNNDDNYSSYSPSKSRSDRDRDTRSSPPGHQDQSWRH